MSKLYRNCIVTKSKRGWGTIVNKASEGFEAFQSLKTSNLLRVQFLSLQFLFL